MAYADTTTYKQYGANTGISSHRRTLTWVRTPLYDRQYELTEKCNSDPELQSTFSLQSKRRNTLPTSPIEYIRQLKKRKDRNAASQNGTGDAVGGDVPATEKVSTKRKEKKAWDIVYFVVGGQSFQCPEWIFQGHPQTLLGNLARRNVYFHAKTKAYYFAELLPDVFTAVLEYYQTGSLTRPERLTLNYFLEQLEIFDLEQVAFDQLLKNEGVYRLPEVHRITDQKLNYRAYMWEVLENPKSGLAGKIYGFLSLFMTILSVVLYITETLPELEKYSLIGRTSISEAFQSPLVIANTVCFVFFFVEFLLRFASCPNLRAFATSWANWTDLLSILPYIIVLILLAVHYDDHRTMPVSVLNTLRGCRLFLVTRILGTSRYYRQHWIIMLVQTLWNNMGTLFVLFFLLIICMVGFGGVIYALEGVGQDAPNFPTIPLGMWWAVITMTTVGYGDVVPTRAPGQILAILCGCVGLMFIGFVLESVTYEYHRLMKANSQYYRYLADLDARKAAAAQTLCSVKHVVSCKGSMQAMAGSYDNEIHVSINGADFYFSLIDLNRHPNSLLGHPSKRSPYFNPTTGSYFFPRNQDIFPSIHQYYRCPGKPIRRPPFISMQRFVEEIEFFQLRPQVVIDFFVSEGIRLVDEKQPKTSRFRYWHLILEHPKYNCLSYGIMIVSMMMTASFTIMVILESIPSLLNPSCSTALSAANGSTINSTIHNMTHSHTFFSSNCREELAFFVVESVCTAWFFLELTARFIVSPSKRDFLKKPMNWVDFLVICPYAFTIVQLTSYYSSAEHVSQLFGFFRTMRLLRLVSILKFARYFKRIQMIFAILQSTWAELLMLCYFMLINSIIFGTFVYIVEYEKVGNFNSIPRGMYWAWITMLTIGYGDMVPQSPWGKVVGAACSILGIVLWTLPMTLISDHFANYRRLYEGQDYVMQCLTRMYHLRDAENKRAGRKTTAPAVNETTEHLLVSVDGGDGKISRDVSPSNNTRPLLGRSGVHSRPMSTMRGAHSRRSMTSSHSQIFNGFEGSSRISRLEVDGLSAAKSKGSFITIASGQTDGHSFN